MNLFENYMVLKLKAALCTGFLKLHEMINHHFILQIHFSLHLTLSVYMVPHLLDKSNYPQNQYSVS